MAVLFPQTGTCSGSSIFVWGRRLGVTHQASHLLYRSTRIKEARASNQARTRTASIQLRSSITQGKQTQAHLPSLPHHHHLPHHVPIQSPNFRLQSVVIKTLHPSKDSKLPPCEQCCVNLPTKHERLTHPDPEPYSHLLSPSAASTPMLSLNFFCTSTLSAGCA